MKKDKYEKGGIGTKANAIYTEALIPSDRGNKLIEALPEEISDYEKINSLYSKSILGYTPEQKYLPSVERRILIQQLKNDFRIALPFVVDLEHEFYTALQKSYRARRNGITCLNGEKIVSTVADDFSSTSGFVMMSHSGCGKSTAFNSLLSHYPQIIIHKDYNDELKEKIQINYIYVQTFPNSNFNALLEEIGAKIDEALGESMYEETIRRTKGGIANKTRVLAKLIEIHSIGAIIFDEIQNIDFKSTKDNTIENLLTLNNMTKVALIMVGTEDAYKKMPSKYRFKRRLGTEIPADRYCSDKNYLTQILQHLFKYQWTKNKIKLTNSIVDTFLEETSGIIDQIVALFMRVQDEYIKTDEKCEIDSNYIKRISNKYYPGLRELLKKEESDDVLKQIQAMRDKSDSEYYEEINKLSYNEKAKKLIESSNKIEKENRIQNVINRINILYDEYSDDVIRECTLDVLNKDSEIDDRELARTVLEKLKAKKAKNSSEYKVSNKTLAKKIKLSEYLKRLKESFFIELQISARCNMF